jgi:hypothetical protein
MMRMAAGGETPPINAWLKPLDDAIGDDATLTLEEETNTVYVSFYSDEGEEIVVEVHDPKSPYDVYVALNDEYECFDVDEHVMDWLEAKRNGVSGVPGVRALVEDAEMIERKLDELAGEAHQFSQNWDDNEEE